MVTALLASAIVLIGVSLWTSYRAQDRRALETSSRVMSWIALGAAIVIPLAVLATFVFPAETAPLNLRLYHLASGRLHEGIPLINRLAAFAIAAVPLAIAVWGLLSLRRLLSLYAQGEVFSQSALKALRAISLSLFWYVLASFAAEGPISLALTFHNPPGQRLVALSLGLDDLVILFLAAVTGVIVRVMGEAARVADENAKFV